VSSEPKNNVPNQEHAEVLGTRTSKAEKPANERYIAPQPEGGLVPDIARFMIEKFTFGCSYFVRKWTSVVRGLRANHELIMAAATVALLMVAILQWLTFEKQWSALESTDQATRNLASAAKSQATAMAGQLRAMYDNQRPWVSSDPRIISGLTYGENGASITIDLRLKTPGRSPAFTVRESGEMTFIKTIKELTEIRDRHCNSVTDAHDDDGEVIFPTADPISQWMQFSGGKSEIAEARAATETIRRLIIPVLVGCIGYVSPEDNSHHKTWFLYNVMHLPPFGIIDPLKGDTPAAELLLVRFPFGNGAD
jgi:hypothetical protein